MRWWVTLRDGHGLGLRGRRWASGGALFAGLPPPGMVSAGAMKVRPPGEVLRGGASVSMPGMPGLVARAAPGVRRIAVPVRVLRAAPSPGQVLSSMIRS